MNKSSLALMIATTLLLAACGGGKDDMAQGAGSDPTGIDAALRAVNTELTAL